MANIGGHLANEGGPLGDMGGPLAGTGGSVADTGGPLASCPLSGILSDTGEAMAGARVPCLIHQTVASCAYQEASDSSGSLVDIRSTPTDTGGLLADA